MEKPQVDVEKMLQFKSEECTDIFTSRDSIIYSLGKKKQLKKTHINK